MRKLIVALSLSGAIWLLVMACSTPAPTPTPAPAPTATSVPAPATEPAEPPEPPAMSRPTLPPSATAPPPTPADTPTPIANTLEPTNMPLPTFTPRPGPTPTNTPAPTIARPTPTPHPTSAPTPAESARNNMEWVRDGLTEEESEFLGRLNYLIQVNEPVGEALLDTSWVRDGVDEREVGAVQRLTWIVDREDRHGWAIVEKLVELPWVQDDITEAEAAALDLVERIDRENEEVVLAIVNMPFLQTFEHDDLLALSAINYMRRRGEDHLETLKQSQIFKDGITDDLTTLVRAAGTIRDADALARWLVPGYADTEVYTGQTTLTSELKISVFRDHGNPRPETMPELVRIAEQLESLMQVPLPNPRLVFVISDQAPTISVNGISQGKRYDFAYGLRGDRENLQRFASQYATGRPMLPSVMIHELGHDYFGNELKSWLNHTPVKTFEYVYRLDGRDRSETPENVLNVIQRRDCVARNIQHLEELSPPNSDRGNRLCHHYLGYWMGRELLEAVGQEEYFARMRRFYYRKEQLVAEGVDPGITEIRELFPEHLEIVERYWSGDVGNPEERYWGGLASLVDHPIEHPFGCCCAGCVPTLWRGASPHAYAVALELSTSEAWRSRDGDGIAFSHAIAATRRSWR